MAMVLNEEHILLQQTAKSFVADKAPVTALRELRDSRDAIGFSRELWNEMVELGWAGVAIPETYGGFDCGYVGLGLILEECGRTLAASPLVSTVLVGATAILLGGSEEQKNELLPAVIGGEKLLALALEETPHHDPAGVALQAEKTAAGFTLTGRKLFVPDGHVADTLIVAARTSGQRGEKDGISLFLVERDAPGVTVERLSMVDSRNAARIEFADVTVPASALLGKLDGGYPLLEQVLDVARIGLSAELLGIAREAFDRTLAYLKERKQFGVLIGSFQALQHRAALMFCELELGKSLVLKGLMAIDQGETAELPKLASLAKGKVCEIARLVTNEAIQMFGGIGMTDEHEIGFYIKRARVAQQTYGDQNYHLERFASLQGY